MKSIFILRNKERILSVFYFTSVGEAMDYAKSIGYEYGEYIVELLIEHQK